MASDFARSPDTSEPTTHQKVVELFNKIGNMEELSRKTTIPVKLLFEARRRSDYEFRDRLLRFNSIASMWRRYIRKHLASRSRTR